MKFLIFLGFVVSPILFFYIEVRADDLSVINIRRNIQLSDTDPIYRDFYIDGGESNGLKKNMVVQAIRKLNIRDASGAHAFGEIKVPVGQLKIIAVYPKLSVAREYKLLSREDLPMLEQIGIMTGDEIETKGSFIDRRPNSLPSSTAFVNPTAPAVATPEALPIVLTPTNAAVAPTILTTANTAPSSTATAPPLAPPAAPISPTPQALVTQPIVTPLATPVPAAPAQSQTVSNTQLN